MGDYTTCEDSAVVSGLKSFRKVKVAKNIYIQ